MVGPLDRAQWLRQAREVLAQDQGTPQPQQIDVTVDGGQGRVTKLSLPAEQSVSGVQTAMSQLEEDIARVVRQAGTITAKGIARRLAISNDGGFRAILSNLTQRRPPVLRSGGEGYRLSDLSDT